MPSLFDRAYRPFALMTERLSENLRGVLWMIVGSIAFGFMGAGIKFAGGSGLHAFEVAFFRSLFGLIALSPFLVRWWASSPCWRRGSPECTFCGRCSVRPPCCVPSTP